jgi:hypothetical protein
VREHERGEVPDPQLPSRLGRVRLQVSRKISPSKSQSCRQVAALIRATQKKIKCPRSAFRYPRKLKISQVKYLLCVSLYGDTWTRVYMCNKSSSKLKWDSLAMWAVTLNWGNIFYRALMRPVCLKGCFDLPCVSLSRSQSYDLCIYS